MWMPPKYLLDGGISMLYNVAQLLRDSVGASREYLVSDKVDYAAEGWGTVHAEGVVTFIRTPRGILVRARLNVETPGQCGRCLEWYQQPVTAEIEEEFFPLIDATTGHPLAVPWAEEPYTIDENHHLDLTEPLRQGILLALPIQTLCRPDCAGLCPRCGHNLNQGPCNCPAEMEDPRWEALRGLLSSP
jgi:uncharacterized protein